MVDEQSTASIQLMKMSDGRCAMNGGDERLTETGLVGDTMFYYFISIDIVGDLIMMMHTRNENETKRDGWGYVTHLYNNPNKIIKSK